MSGRKVSSKPAYRIMPVFLFIETQSFNAAQCSSTCSVAYRKCTVPYSLAMNGGYRNMGFLKSFVSILITPVA
jgi:hypothetical protein